jgi:hypothetical protein
MSEFTNINKENQNSLPRVDTIISQPNELQGLDQVIINNNNNNFNNNDLINLDQNPEIKEPNPIIKEPNKSSENEPLTFHESSEVIQIPMTQSSSNSYESPNTLDEAILTTILRDLNLIYTKLKFVVIPYGSKDKKSYHIKQWDLWGPLILNLLLAGTLAFNSEDKSQMIILVFLIFWMGGVILYLNANFLGVNTSIFQIFCLLGYCLFPLNVSAIFISLFNINDALRFLIVGTMCAWSIYSSSDYLKNMTNQDQRYLVLYPCILFYLYISWFIVSTKK